MKSQYLQGVLERAEDEWCDEACAEGKWSEVKRALVSTAEKVLGRAGGLKPSWFQGSIVVLQLFFVARSAAYSRWLGTGRMEDLSKFRQARNTAKRANRKAKNDWFQEKAREIEKKRFGGKKAWKAIREIQCECRELLPGRMAVINDEEGVPCSSKEAQQQRWSRHFTKVPNLGSQYKDDRGVRVSATEGGEWEHSRQAYCK